MLEVRIDYSNYQVVILLRYLMQIIMYSYDLTSFPAKTWPKYPRSDPNYLTCSTSGTDQDVVKSRRCLRSQKVY